jgi:TPR repeat protein
MMRRVRRAASIAALAWIVSLTSAAAGVPFATVAPRFLADRDRVAYCQWVPHWPSGRMVRQDELTFSILCRFPSETGTLSIDEKDKAGAGAGDVPAMLRLGAAYLAGPPESRDPATGARWFMKAAARKSVPAMLVLSELYRQGIGVAPDAGASFKWLREAAQNGDAVAMYMVAWQYHSGGDAPLDEAQSRRWIRRLADSGPFPAPDRCRWATEVFPGAPEKWPMLQCGFEFLHGSMGRGFLDGFDEHTVAKARSGDMAAIKLLARFYLTAPNEAKDPAAGAEWCRKAADRGDAEAMRLLASLYHLGLGVPQDETESKRWLQSAATAGDDLARQILAGTAEMTAPKPVMYGPVAPMPARRR